MKREIKFRGMSLIVGFCEWRYGFFSTYPKGAHITTPDGECWPVAIESVGQFTGLKDTNGKEIYEGDIYQYLVATGYHEDTDEYEWDVAVGVVEYSTVAGHPAIGYVLRAFESDREVIGNIYENPDLLK